MPILRRSLAAVSVICISTAGILAAAPGSGRAETTAGSGVDGRSLTLDQSTGLDTRAVRVAWAGFNPTRRNGQYAVNLVQCAAAPTALDRDCFNAQRYPNSEQGSIVLGATTRSDGTGNALFEVRAALDLVELGCAAAKPCTVLAYEVTGTPVAPGTMPEFYAYATIEFAPSPADCPAVVDFDARIGGAASAMPLAYRIAGTACTAADPSILDVTESSSNEGREAVFEDQLDLGITSVGATVAERAAHPEVVRVRYAPLDLTAVVVAYNLADPFTNEPITDLTLSPRLVARIVSGTRPEEFFADPEFQLLNPGRRWPQGGFAQPLLRAEANADTGIVTNWITTNGPARAFLDGTDSYGEAVTPAWRNVPYPIDVFESRAASSGYIPLTGQRTVGQRLFYGVVPANFTTAVNYTGVIGVVDLPTARRYGLGVARIVNASGNAVTPTDDAILAGYRSMVVNADGTKAADPGATDPVAYPLVKIDYGMVTDALDPRRVAKTARFITETVGAVQDAGLPGYVALPAVERQQATAVASSLDALISGIDLPSLPTGDLGPSAGGFDPGSDGGGSDLLSDGTGAPGGGPGTPATLVRKGLARFQPVVAVSDPSGPSGLVLVLALGVITGLAALAPSAWSLGRRLLHR
ncbi:MAG: hypothetical protein ACKO72_10900 [Actinomycetes bacterium]